MIKLHEQGLSQIAIATMVGLHLIAQIRAQGFQGSDTIVFDYLRPFREEPAWMETYQQRKQQIARGVSKKLLSAYPR